MGSNNKNSHKSWGAVLLYFFLIIFGLLILLVSLYFLKQINSYKGNQIENTNNVNSQIIYQLKSQKKYDNPAGNDALNYYFGTTSPLVRIVMYSDFTCPMSQNSFHKIRKLGLKYKDQVKVIFRDHPGGQDGLKLSLAANCAGDQGKFWQMHDKLFRIMQTSKNIPTDNELAKIARNIGVESGQFEKCLASQKFKDEIKKDLTDAEKMNVEGTPTWFFNGYKISGDMPYDLMKSIIKSLIENEM